MTPETPADAMRDMSAVDPRPVAFEPRPMRAEIDSWRRGWMAP
jgi:hypothetical protein